MENNNDDKNIHQFSVNQEGKGIQLNMQTDLHNPEHAARMAELFKEVSDSNPESIADFLIRLNEINKI